jgi:carbonic anhydrase
MNRPGEDRMPVSDQLIENNRSHAGPDVRGEPPTRPTTHVAIVTCMDARIDPVRMLGLQWGDAHVLRNAGGVVTEDTVRSLMISQRLLGTSEIILIHHTDCGMLTFRDDELKDAVEAETGIRPTFATEAFTDLDDDVRRSIARIQGSPFVPRTQVIRGFVYDVHTGRLREVD